jgi:hypothetical protein
MKKCSKCKIHKELIFFGNRKSSKDGLQSNCKSCRNEYYEKTKYNLKEYYKERNKIYYNDNREKIIAKTKEYRECNKDYYINYSKKYWKLYYKNNKEKIKNYYENNKERKNYNINKKKKLDPIFKFKCNVRTSIRMSFKRGKNQFKKSAKTENILGCTIEQFKDYIESKFTKGMNFENYGKWHLDHIKPLALAKNEKEIIELNHYTNFQPLWAEDNYAKGAKY